MKILKPEFWNKKNNLFSIFLLPLSLFLQILVKLRNIMIKAEKLPIPVICVGNIYLGGTGKTPLCIEIVRILQKFNKKTAIIKKSYAKHMDEFKLIKSKKIKLFKNNSRILAIKDAVSNKFDCVILDDGFQDPSISKDLNIICFDGKQLAGNGMTLPSGPLREPLSSLKNCQIVIICGDVNDEFEKEIKNISKNIIFFYSKYIPTNIESFKGHNLLAFAGIGNPKNFFNLLDENNLKVIKRISFPDHYSYSLKELNKLIDFALENNLKLITTEKDFFRINHHNLSQIDYLSLKLEIKKNDIFEKEIVKYL